MKKEKEKKENKFDQKVKELEEALKRSQADFANFKRRSQEEKKGIMSLAKIEVILSILPIYESCRRAVDADDCTEGLRKILESFDNVLKNHQIEKIDLDMDKFDPTLAEAVGFKDGDKDNNGKIAEVVEVGFMMGDEVVKPAKVLIFKSE